MALSKAQKQILDKFNIPQELQDWIALGFNEQGQPKVLGAPDFLMVISDHLLAAEIYLETQRLKLKIGTGPKQAKQAGNRSQQVGQEEWQALLRTYEEVVKEAWLRATGYWRIIDELVSKPEDYGIKLKRQHIEYAFQNKNLPLVEILKWAKPEYFSIPSPSSIIRLWSGLWGGIGGGVSGIIGGLSWAKSRVKNDINRTDPIKKARPWLYPFLCVIYILIYVIYGLRGILTGIMMGTVTGASLGYHVGKVSPAVRMGYYAAAFNPFSESPGSKSKQALDLKIAETLFRLAAKNEIRVIRVK